jgi:ParB-like chromosome segregation protein Spo0J
MKLIDINPDELKVSPELNRSGSAKSFEDRLRSSIAEIGLAEPLKIARQSDNSYLVIDGNLRLRAIRAIRAKDPDRFQTIAAYVVEYTKRFEIRFQSDIYQDLLPSQLATLVEHLHKTENVLKVDIARYIGVSPPTLRNYTGLWRLMERGGLFASVVDLMDVGVFPSSNPYAWLRLTDEGLHKVLVTQFGKREDVDAWAEEAATNARLGAGQIRYPLKYVELVTAALAPQYYRHGEDVRAIKRDLGLRRAVTQADAKSADLNEARKNLLKVSRRSLDPVLRSAAESLQEYLA